MNNRLNGYHGPPQEPEPGGVIIEAINELCSEGVDLHKIQLEDDHVALLVAATEPYTRKTVLTTVLLVIADELGLSIPGMEG